MLINRADPVRISKYRIDATLSIQRFRLPANKISSEVWSNGNAPCETLLWRCGSLVRDRTGVELSGCPPVSRLHPHAARAPLLRLFLLRHLDAFSDLFWPAHSFPPFAQSGVWARVISIPPQLRFCLHLLLVHNYCSAAVCSNCSFFWDWL